MKPSERTYRGRPTKWSYLNQYYEAKRTTMKKVQERMQHLLGEGRLSMQYYLGECNIERNEGYLWIEHKLKLAQDKKDPTAYLNQINIYKLEQSVHDFLQALKRIAEYLDTQEELPLEETDGYAYNKRFNVSLADVRAFANNPKGFEKEDDIVEEDPLAIS